MKTRYVLAIVFVVQIICAVFFVAEILIDVLGLPVEPISWTVHEAIEVGAALGLVLGVAISGWALVRARARSARAEEALRVAQSAFRDMLDERFDAWGLTPAEQDVALFAIKGFSTADIAQLRNVSEGTVKAQTAAIYRKAGVSGRSQLLALFIDDLVDTEDQASVA